jgi:hypothetical protein
MLRQSVAHKTGYVRGARVTSVASPVYSTDRIVNKQRLLTNKLLFEDVTFEVWEKFAQFSGGGGGAHSIF